VLITDRRIVADSASWPVAPETAEDVDFTVIEMRVDGRAMGEGKVSVAGAVLDSAAGTLTLEGYDHVPAVLKVTR